jgi:hypothetical protein
MVAPDDRSTVAPSPSAQSQLQRPILALLAVTSALVVIGCLARQFVSWRNFGDLESEGGMWTTLALDAANGIVYRPIFSPLGYGGTRYSPLHFLIHAAFLKAGALPIASGFLMGIACALVTLAGIYVLMRKLQTPRSLAIPLTTFFLAAFCVRSGILSIKADLLATSLDVWGMIAALGLLPSPGTPGEGQGGGSSRPWPRAILAAICFALAVAAKITSLFGVCTIVTWLLLRRDFKNAARVLIIFLLAVGGIITAVQFASEGRLSHIFLLSASANSGLRRLLQAPYYFFHAAAIRDRAVGAFWLAAMVALLCRPHWTSLPTILMGYSTLGTVAIFGTHGTDMNHLMDLQIASLTVLAVQCRSGNLAGGILVFVVLISLHAAHSCVNDIHLMRTERNRHHLLACLSDTEKSFVNGPIFSDNPIIPILAGQRPYMLDCMIFSAIDVRHYETQDALISDLTRQHFRAVIVNLDLTHNTISTPTDPWPGILDIMKTKYQLTDTQDRNQVYLPKMP